MPESAGTGEQEGQTPRSKRVRLLEKRSELGASFKESDPLELSIHTFKILDGPVERSLPATPRPPLEQIPRLRSG
jgi:hypothetical protein